VVVLVVEIHPMNHQATQHQAVEMLDSVVVLDLVAVLDSVVLLAVDLNHHHLRSNQARTVVLAVVDSTNKVYK
jgi:hypothetical protein